MARTKRWAPKRALTVQNPPPREAVEILKRIPLRFLDDGCSSSPDSWFGFNFRWCCRIHDYGYCTRCHPPGSRTQTEKKVVDRQLRVFIQGCLPWRWKWLGWVYQFAVRRYGNRTGWDSCGPVPSGTTVVQRKRAVCRHNMPAPDWMLRLVAQQEED